MCGFRWFSEYAYSGLSYSGPYSIGSGTQYGGVYDFRYNVEDVVFYGFSIAPNLKYSLAVFHINSCAIRSPDAFSGVRLVS